jgi:serine/threonine-protein kinase
VAADSERTLARLLPTFAPPYPVPAIVPGTQYRLEELAGTGGFGAVYRAASPGMQHLPLAMKFCLDRTLAMSLERERAVLERLMRAGGENWSSRLVRLYGYDLDHPTPYLVCEYVPGGDLAAHVARLGRPLTPDEAAGLVASVAEGLAFAHESGLVHRDLKPANVLMARSGPRLADFGVGGLAARQALAGGRLSLSDRPNLSEQAGMLRGAGTPLYMSPEQRQQADPDPRQDVFSLGVVWYQLLVGDVTREMHPGWDRELEVRHQVPREHIEAIRRCVGWLAERPRDGAETLALVRDLGKPAVPVASFAEESPILEALPAFPRGRTEDPPVLEARPAPPPRPTPRPGSSVRVRRAVILARLGEIDAARIWLEWDNLPVVPLLWAIPLLPLLYVLSLGCLLVFVSGLEEFADLDRQVADAATVPLLTLVAGIGGWLAVAYQRGAWRFAVPAAGVALGLLWSCFAVGASLEARRANAELVVPALGAVLVALTLGVADCCGTGPGW